MSPSMADSLDAPERRIVEVRAGVVPAPFPAPFAAGPWVMDAVYNVVAAVRSASGTWGFGYAFDFDPGGAQTLMAAIKSLGARACSADVFDTEHVHALLRAGNYWGSTGLYAGAIGALDIAVWDLKGRLLGVPVHCLLGSTVTRVPAYASGGGFNLSHAELERELKGYLDEGFTAVKIKLPQDVKEACARIVATRSWLGSDVKIMYDMNQMLARGDALLVAACAAENGAYWLEEPLPHWDLQGHSELKARVRCRIALGESLYGPRAFYDAIRLGAADVLMPDLQRIGGVTAWLTIRGLADAAGVPLSSHIMSEVSAHVMSATRHTDLLEYVHFSKPLYEHPFEPEGGCLVISPGEPGFGLEPSEAVRRALEL